MAYKEEIIIDVIENGLDQANAKLKDLKSNSEEASTGQKNLGTSVLENGGAMGLLNDATGGLAMTIKDGVESLALFTKGSTLATTAQKIYTLVVGASTGGMKLFRLALASTGIGLLVVGLGLLIANFDKVKKVVMSAIPGLAIIGNVISGLIDAVTDFIGVTSDATRALDQMVKKSEESLKRNEHFLEANGDKYDQYTRKKLQANIDYNKKVVELNQQFQEGEIKTIEELNSKLSDFRQKANREIVGADKERDEEQAKKAKEQADKLADIAKAAQDKANAKAKEQADRERERLNNIAKIQDDYRKKVEDLDAKTDQAKRDLEEKRQLAELDTLKASKKQKQEVIDYYDRLEFDAKNLAIEERNQIEKNKVEAERQAVLDQQQWLIDNGEDGLVKLEKQRELLALQAEFDLEKLDYLIQTSEADSQAKLDAQTAYNARKQQKDNDLLVNEKAIADEKLRIEKAVADGKKAIQEQGFNVASAGIGLLKSLAGESKAIQKGALIAESAIGIAKMVIANKAANVAALATPQAILTSGASAIPVIALNNVSTGIGIAANLLATSKALSSLGGGGGGSAPSGGGDSGGSSAPAPTPAPSFNLVQGTGANQIAQAIGSQNTPIQAYVVPSNVTTGQALDRNIIQNSRF